MATQVRFDTFMQYALFDLERGYYAKNIHHVGRDGDFSTTASLSNILAFAIADQIRQQPETDIIEIGAGSGQLMHALQSCLKKDQRRYRFHIVESSAPLQQRQRERLGKRSLFGFKKSVTHWHNDIHCALKDCRQRAFIFSNELVDAFPVRCFRRVDDQFEELFLSQGKELFLPVETVPDSTSFDIPHNQYFEVHASYHAWLQSWIPDWQSGTILTIDYGDIAETLYHKKPRGSLRAYWKHNLITGMAIYQNIGNQDITADVNFTDLIRWGKELGLKAGKALMTQAEFLAPYVSEDDPKSQFLTSEAGAGTAFKVLVQEKC